MKAARRKEDLWHKLHFLQIQQKLFSFCMFPNLADLSTHFVSVNAAQRGFPTIVSNPGCHSPDSIRCHPWCHSVVALADMTPPTSDSLKR
jgi:hypothetical protein